MRIRANHRIQRVISPFWSQVLIGTIALSFVLSVFLTQTELKINQTPSLGYKIFFCIKGLEVKREDFVSFKEHPTAYFGNISYTKRLVGLPGDRIRVRGSSSNSQLLINDKLMGALRTMTRDGKPLTPLKAKVITEGYIFVGADHPHSFDSRYEEFGLVKKACVSAKCFGFFKSHDPHTSKNTLDNTSRNACTDTIVRTYMQGFYL